MKTSRGIQSKPLANRWDASKLAGITATPSMRRKARDVAAEFPEKEVTKAAEARPAEREVRDFRITSDILRKHGYTKDCEQCGYIQRYGHARPGGRHGTECRERIRKELVQSEEGMEKLQDLEKILERSIAEGLERADAEGRRDKPRDDRKAQDDFDKAVAEHGSDRKAGADMELRNPGGDAAPGGDDLMEDIAIEEDEGIFGDAGDQGGMDLDTLDIDHKRLGCPWLGPPDDGSQKPKPQSSKTAVHQEGTQPTLSAVPARSPDDEPKDYVGSISDALAELFSFQFDVKSF